MGYRGKLRVRVATHNYYRLTDPTRLPQCLINIKQTVFQTKANRFLVKPDQQNHPATQLKLSQI